MIYLNSTLVIPKPGTSFTPADEAADQAFVAFLLEPKGRRILSASATSCTTRSWRPERNRPATGALPPAILCCSRLGGGKLGW